MTNRTGRAVSLIIVTILAPGVIAGCSKGISGQAKPNAADLAAHLKEVAEKKTQEVTTKACTDFRDGFVQVNLAINDFVDAYNNNNGYGGAGVDTKLSTAVSTIDKWTGTIGTDLVPEVAPDVSGPLNDWKNAATKVRDGFDTRGDVDVVNAATDDLNAKKGVAQSACGLY